MADGGNSIGAVLKEQPWVNWLVAVILLLIVFFHSPAWVLSFLIEGVLALVAIGFLFKVGYDAATKKG